MDAEKLGLLDLLRQALGLLDAWPADADTLAHAGAAIEQAAAVAPTDIPRLGTLLSLCLEVLEAVCTGELDDHPSVDAVREAVAAAVARLDDAVRTDYAATIDQTGGELWSLLGRDKQLSPFALDDDAQDITRSPDTAAEWLALLIGLRATDVRELRALGDWLAGLEADESADDDARRCAHEAAEVLHKLLAFDTDDPDRLLSEVVAAVEQLANATKPPARNDDSRADRSHEPPVCLQFVGDASLLAEFVVEALEHVETAEAAMLALEADPDDAEAVNSVFRAFHTIKGAAGFLGLTHMQELAHRAESLLARVRAGDLGLTGNCADLALQSCDLIKAMLADLDGWSAGELPPPPSGYDELLSRLSAPESGSTDHHGPDGDAPTIRDVTMPSPGEERGATGPRPTTHVLGHDTVRVRTDRLDALINMVGELVIANAMLAQDEELRSTSAPALDRKIDQISKITRELQNMSMSLRMVPFTGIFNKMARAVRDIARKSGKQVNFVTEGEDTEIDRHMVENIADPLLHMVRNAVDHGIEPPAQRRAAGKPEVGTIILRACHAAGSVVIELEDDGRGLDRDRILEKAVRNGVIADGIGMSDEDVYRLIFTPGLSTAEQVTDISGRGVGMDVVRRNIEAMRGRIDIASTPGEGTIFIIRIPLTLAIIDGMLLRVGDEQYILPTVNIIRLVRPDPVSIATVGGTGEMVNIQGQMVPIIRVHHLFGVSEATECIMDGLLVITATAGPPVALLVDELLGQQQIVIKSLGHALQVPGVSGAAILGDGRVGLILDVDGLVRLAHGEKIAA